MIKVWLKDKVVGLTKLSKTEGNVDVLSAILKLISQFVNIFSANKVAMFCYVNLLYCLLNCVTETIQVTKGHKHFPEGSVRTMGHMLASPDIINNT